jgi:hypothetical protein
MSPPKLWAWVRHSRSLVRCESKWMIDALTNLGSNAGLAKPPATASLPRGHLAVTEPF